MDEVAAVNAWFTPFHYMVYLGVPFIGFVLYQMWHWANICRENVLVLIKKADGHGGYQLAPQEGGSVSLKNPNSNTIRLWPINELATIGVPYPGVGFVPSFLQKEIRMVIVDEEDWEPLTNRGSYNVGIASPDVIKSIIGMANNFENGQIKTSIIKYAESLSPAMTREMIASPAVLGNLMHEKITEAVITVNKEMLDSISGLIKKLNKLVNPTVVYIGLGLTVILVLYMAYQISPLAEQVSELASKIDRIQQALGVVGASTN